VIYFQIALAVISMNLPYHFTRGSDFLFFGFSERCEWIHGDKDVIFFGILFQVPATLPSRTTVGVNTRWNLGKFFSHTLHQASRYDLFSSEYIHQIPAADKRGVNRWMRMASPKPSSFGLDHLVRQTWTGPCSIRHVRLKPSALATTQNPQM
jgi:hypothetical protein